MRYCPGSAPSARTRSAPFQSSLPSADTGWKRARLTPLPVMVMSDGSTPYSRAISFSENWLTVSRIAAFFTERRPVKRAMRRNCFVKNCGCVSNSVSWIVTAHAPHGSSGMRYCTCSRSMRYLRCSRASCQPRRARPLLCGISTHSTLGMPNAGSASRRRAGSPQKKTKSYSGARRTTSRYRPSRWLRLPWNSPSKVWKSTPMRGRLVWPASEEMEVVIRSGS